MSTKQRITEYNSIGPSRFNYSMSRGWTFGTILFILYVGMSNYISILPQYFGYWFISWFVCTLFIYLYYFLIDEHPTSFYCL
jgi:hypothetical protein